MSRHAVWRRNPEDPKTVRQWFFRANDDRDARLLAAILTMVALMGVGAYLGHPILLFAAIPGISNLLTRKEERRLGEILESPAPLDVRPATLVVHNAEGTTTGKDVGWLMVVDGWLMFEGRRVSLSVSRGEARGRMSKDAIHLRLEDGRLCNLFPVQAKPRAVPLNPLLERWNAAPIPNGEAILPPRETHPEVWSNRFAQWLAGAFALLAGAGLLLTTIFPVAILAFLGASICVVEALDCIGKLRKELPAALPSHAEP